MKKLLVALTLILAGCDSDVDLTGHWSADQCNTKPLCSFTITGEGKKPQSLYIKFDDAKASQSASGHLIKASKGTYTVKAPTGDYTMKLKGDDLYGVNNTKYHKDMKNPNLAPTVNKEPVKDEKADAVGTATAVATGTAVGAATGADKKQLAIKEAPVATIQQKPLAIENKSATTEKPAATIQEKPVDTIQKPAISERPAAIPAPAVAPKPATTENKPAAIQSRPPAVESKPAAKPAQTEKREAIATRPSA